MGRLSNSPSARPWIFFAFTAVSACAYYYSTFYTTQPEGLNACSGVKRKRDQANTPSPPEAPADHGPYCVEDLMEMRPEQLSILHTGTMPTLAQVDEGLRKRALAWKFESIDDRMGHIDAICLPNSPYVETRMQKYSGPGIGGQATLYNGIFTGHFGTRTSAVLTRALFSYLCLGLIHLREDADDEAVDEVIKTAFTTLDDRIMTDTKRYAESDAVPAFSPEAFETISPVMSGSCAIVSMLDTERSTLRVALTGDSRAVLGSWCPEAKKYYTDPITEDQTGLNEREMQRLEALHPGEISRLLNKSSGKFMDCRWTRSFGDHRWKWPDKIVQTVAEKFFGFDPLLGDHPTPPYFTAMPEVSTRHGIKPQDFLILGSAGLWQLMSSETAVECVSQWLAAVRSGRPVVPPPAARTMDSPVGQYGYPSWGTCPRYFVIEDLYSAAICLVKNAMGGSRREMFLGMAALDFPLCRLSRDDLAVQVIFFSDPYEDQPG